MSYHATKICKALELKVAAPHEIPKTYIRFLRRVVAFGNQDQIASEAVSIFDQCCWTWGGYKDPNGYGQFRIGDRVLWAHRASHAMFIGPIPGGMEVDHCCRNPECVKPTHLRLKTPSENRRNTRRHGKKCDPLVTQADFTVDVLEAAERTKTVIFQVISSNAPGRTRTFNLLIRSQPLYPIELRARHPVCLSDPAGITSWTLAGSTIACGRRVRGCHMTARSAVLPVPKPKQAVWQPRG